VLAGSPATFLAGDSFLETNNLSEGHLKNKGKLIRSGARGKLRYESGRGKFAPPSKESMSATLPLVKTRAFDSTMRRMSGSLLVTATGSLEAPVAKEHTQTHRGGRAHLAPKKPSPAQGSADAGGFRLPTKPPFCSRLRAAASRSRAAFACVLFCSGACLCGCAIPRLRAGQEFVSRQGAASKAP
jgi:hypothetical protein